MNFKPTQAVQNNIARGLALKAKYQRTTPIAKSLNALIEKSKISAMDDLSIDTVMYMYTELSKMNVDVRKLHPDGGPTEDVLKWYSLGGQAGLSWAKLVLKSQNLYQGYFSNVKPEDADKEEESEIANIAVIKSVDQDLMQVTYVAMQEGVDLHGDLVTLDEVRKAKESFNKSLMKANLFHLQMTDTFSVAESYLAPCDMVLNGHVITKGTWLMTLQVNDDDVWNAIKNEQITGISIGAVARVENLE
jgi:Putative phage serine protease XkdF